MIEIEQIEGRPYTCIMSCAVRTTDKGAEDIPDGWNSFDVEGLHGEIITIGESTTSDGATVRGVCAVYLPPLPLHPLPKHAKLLAAYQYHGMDAIVTAAPLCKKRILMRFRKDKAYLLDKDGIVYCYENPKDLPLIITHAIDSATGARVEIAIEEGA